MMMEWHPIETAPKDGTVVDLKMKSGAVCLDEWWIEEDGEAFWSCDFDDSYVTHWRQRRKMSGPAE